MAATKNPKIQKSKAQIMPASGFILIEPFEVQTKTTSGIYLPENATTEKPQKGKVIAVGEDEVLNDGSKRKTPVKVGNTVVYKKWGGNEYKEEGKEYSFIKFEDILAIIK